MSSRQKRGRGGEGEEADPQGQREAGCCWFLGALGEPKDCVQNSLGCSQEEVGPAGAVPQRAGRAAAARGHCTT